MEERERCQPWVKTPESLERCPLAAACQGEQLAPLLARIAINDGCRTPVDSYSPCGGVAAYYEAALHALYLDVLDETAPVTHHARIITPPAGIAPDVVRQQVVGTTVRIREALRPEDTRAESVFVAPIDLRLALYDDGKFAAAAWYDKYIHSLEVDEQVRLIWEFQGTELHLYEASHTRSTAADYAMFAWSKRGLGAMATAGLQNDALFVSRSPYGKIFYEALQEVADERFEGNLTYSLHAYVINKLSWWSRASAGEFSRGRTTTYNHANEVLAIRDNGILIYDREQGIDYREHPEAAPRPVNEKPLWQVVEELVSNKGGRGLLHSTRQIQ